MLIVNVTLDTQQIGVWEISSLLEDGQVLHGVGVLNNRRRDFSAQEAAQEAGLSGVEWDCVADDPPGSLELKLWYPHQKRNKIEHRLKSLNGVEAYEIYEYVHGVTDM